MNKQPPTEAEMMKQQDEALAAQIESFVKDEGGTIDSNGLDSNISLALATHLRTQVINPATLAGATKLLQAHRDALYGSIPEGELDAMDMLNILQNHLAKLDETLAGLKRVQVPEAEVVEGEDKKA